MHKTGTDTGFESGTSTARITLNGGTFSNLNLVLKNSGKPTSQSQFCSSVANPASRFSVVKLGAGDGATVNSCTVDSTVGQMAARGSNSTSYTFVYTFD